MSENLQFGMKVKQMEKEKKTREAYSEQLRQEKLDLVEQLEQAKTSQAEKIVEVIKEAEKPPVEEKEIQTEIGMEYFDQPEPSEHESIGKNSLRKTNLQQKSQGKRSQL